MIIFVFLICAITVKILLNEEKKSVKISDAAKRIKSKKIRLSIFCFALGILNLTIFSPLSLDILKSSGGTNYFQILYYANWAVPLVAIPLALYIAFSDSIQTEFKRKVALYNLKDQVNVNSFQYTKFDWIVLAISISQISLLVLPFLL